MLQDILTLIIVLVCALLLGRRMVRSIRRKDCGGCCGHGGSRASGCAGCSQLSHRHPGQGCAGCLRHEKPHGCPRGK